MEKVFGRDIGVQNEATREGNKAIEELKRGTAVKELKAIEQDIQTANKKINALKKEEKQLDKQIKELENTFKGEQLTMKKIENIKPIKGLFGLKNVTMDDIESLKGMAMIPLQDKKALNKAKQEIEELKIENAEQKKKIPTMAQEMSRNQKIINLQDKNNKLIRDYNELVDRYDNLADAVGQLPAKEIEFINNIINAAEAPEDWEYSQGMEL
jgi:predicted  nucleic acid-binding Zn-ribbon protein